MKPSSRPTMYPTPASFRGTSDHCAQKRNPAEGIKGR